MRCGPYQSDGLRAEIDEERTFCGKKCKYFAECRKEIGLPDDAPIYYWYLRKPTPEEVSRGKYHTETIEHKNGTVEDIKVIWDRIPWGQYEKLCKQKKRLPGVEQKRFLKANL